MTDHTNLIEKLYIEAHNDGYKDRPESAISAEAKKNLRDALEAQQPVAQSAPQQEQSAFETWLENTCPSGDATEVQRQWEASYDYQEWLEQQTVAQEQPVAQPAEAPDCRTCKNLKSNLAGGHWCQFICTNGDQYQPAPKVVLWRTE